MGVTTVSPILTTDITFPLQALQLVDHPCSLALTHLMCHKPPQMDRSGNHCLERFELSNWSRWIPGDNTFKKEFNSTLKIFGTTRNPPL